MFIIYSSSNKLVECVNCNTNTPWWLVALSVAALLTSFASLFLVSMRSGRISISLEQKTVDLSPRIGKVRKEKLKSGVAIGNFSIVCQGSRGVVVNKILPYFSSHPGPIYGESVTPYIEGDGIYRETPFGIESGEVFGGRVEFKHQLTGIDEDNERYFIERACSTIMVQMPVSIEYQTYGILRDLFHIKEPKTRIVTNTIVINVYRWVNHYLSMWRDGSIEYQEKYREALKNFTSTAEWLDDDIKEDLNKLNTKTLTYT